MSAASDVFPVLPHDPKGNIATQFSSKTVAHPYNHRDIDFNRQPCRGQTPAELFSVSKPNMMSLALPVYRTNAGIMDVTASVSQL
jgi:hypothetical protein